MSAPPFLSPMLVSYEGQWGNQRADLVMNADSRAEETLTPVQRLLPLDLTPQLDGNQRQNGRYPVSADKCTCDL